MWFLNMLGICLALHSMSHFNVEPLPLSVIFIQHPEVMWEGVSGAILGAAGANRFIAGYVALSSGPCWQA